MFVAHVFAKLDYIFPYVLAASKIKIRVWIVETNINSLSKEILVERNNHDIPIEVIEDQILNFEKITQEDIDILLRLPEKLRGKTFNIPKNIFGNIPDKLKASPPWE